MNTVINLDEIGFSVTDNKFYTTYTSVLETGTFIHHALLHVQVDGKKYQLRNPEPDLKITKVVRGWIFTFTMNEKDYKLHILI